MRKRQIMFKKKFEDQQEKLDNILLKVDKIEQDFNSKVNNIDQKMNENFEYINNEIDNSNKKFQNIQDNLEKILLRFKIDEKRIEDLENATKSLSA